MWEYKGQIIEGVGRSKFVFIQNDTSKVINLKNKMEFDDVKLMFGFYKCVNYIKGISERLPSNIVYIDKMNGLLFDKSEDLGTVGRYIMDCSNEEIKTEKGIAVAKSLQDKRKIFENFKNFVSEKLDGTYKELIENAETRKLISDLSKTI